MARISIPSLRLGIAGGLAALSMWGAGMALAEAESEQESFGYQLAHDMMSPFCPGRTLAQCPSGQAEELRVWILAHEESGESKEEVEAQLVALYGEEIWPSPPAAGLSGAGAYGIPLAMLIAGGPAAFFILRRLTSTQSDSPQPAAASTSAAEPIDADLSAEIDRELKELGA